MDLNAAEIQMNPLTPMVMRHKHKRGLKVRAPVFKRSQIMRFDTYDRPTPFAASKLLKKQVIPDELEESGFSGLQSDSENSSESGSSEKVLNLLPCNALDSNIEGEGGLTKESRDSMVTSYISCGELDYRF